MMSAINVATDPPTQRTPRHNVRQVMLVSRKPGHADRGRNPISSDLHRRAIFVLVGDNSRDGPRLCSVTGRKRTAAIEELAAFAAIQRSSPLRNSFQSAFDNNAVD